MLTWLRDVMDGFAGKSSKDVAAKMGSGVNDDVKNLFKKASTITAGNEQSILNDIQTYKTANPKLNVANNGRLFYLEDYFNNAKNASNSSDYYNNNKLLTVDSDKFLTKDFMYKTLKYPDSMLNKWELFRKNGTKAATVGILGITGIGSLTNHGSSQSDPSQMSNPNGQMNNPNGQMNNPNGQIPAGGNPSQQGYNQNAPMTPQQAIASAEAIRRDTLNTAENIGNYHLLDSPGGMPDTMDSFNFTTPGGQFDTGTGFTQQQQPMINNMGGTGANGYPGAWNGAPGASGMNYPAFNQGAFYASMSPILSN